MVTSLTRRLAEIFIATAGEICLLFVTEAIVPS